MTGSPRDEAGSPRDETGQISLMVIGFLAMLVLAIAVVTDASAAFLQQSGLATVADGAALAGSEALDESGVYAGGVGAMPQLDPGLARASIAAYLRETGAHDRFPGLSWSPRVVGNEVVVDVSAPLDLPLDVPGVPGTARISATGTAILDPLS